MTDVEFNSLLGAAREAAPAALDHGDRINR